MRNCSARIGFIFLVLLCVSEEATSQSHGQEKSYTHTASAGPSPVISKSLGLSEIEGSEATLSGTGLVLPVVHTEIVTTASAHDDLSPDASSLHSSSMEDIRTTAGAYSDLPRYLQVLPGIASDTDSRNSFMVHGGNPAENLFVVNDIEMPNINQLSTLNSTAGFISMIDTEMLSQVDLHAGSYSSKYTERLSSVLNIRTQEIDQKRRHTKINIGYAGVGAIASQPIADKGGIMFSLRRSLMDQFTNDIGINGVPKYMSSLSTFDYMLTERDKLSGVVLGGIDSIDIRPNILDGEDPGFVNTVHKGSNYTAGIIWQHTYSPTSFADLSITQSYQHTNDQQTDALTYNAPVSSSNMTERSTVVKYDAYIANGSLLNVRMGSSIGFEAIRYNVDQSGGFPNPYQVNPKPMDAFRFNPDVQVMNQAYYGETTWTPKHMLNLTFGSRYQRWGLNGASSLNPHINATVHLSERAYVYAGYKQSSQLPPYPYMLAVPSNKSLRPIESSNIETGVAFQNAAGDKITLSYFAKEYKNYPVATEYPTLSMANVIDTFGTPFLYFPMASQGDGRSSGYEIFAQSSHNRSAYIQAAFTAASTKYTALDGVWRRGNYDYPYMGTLLAGYHIGGKYNFNLRYSTHTGGPYTPFLLAESKAQRRPIYDVSQANTGYAPSYARLDVRFERTFKFGNSTLKAYGGLLNALDKKNFYQYVFVSNSKRLYELTQMGRYPDVGIVFNF